MAEALNKLSQAFKSGSGLAQTSQEELQALSAASERPMQPITPQSAAGIGANPDQAKMAGASANKLAALRTSIQSAMDLGTTQRREQAHGKTGTPEAQLKEQQAAKLQQFTGALDDRVQHIVTQKMSEAAAPGKLTVSEEALKGVPNADAVKPLLEKVGAGTATPQDLATINQSLGYADQPMSAEQLQRFFLTGSEDLGQALASRTPDQLQVKDLNLDTLGMGSKQDVAQLLGSTPEELDGMNLQQLLDKAQAVRQQNFTHTENLQKQATSPLLGQAERAQARAELRGIGATGERTAEQQVQDLQDQIQEANTVKIGNQDISVETLLQDDTMKGMVANYLENPEQAAAIKANNPDLAEWIDTNAKGLAQLTAGLSNQVKALASVEESNRAMAQIGPGVSVPDSVMKTLVPTWGTKTGQALQPPPILQAIKTSSPQIQQSLVQGLTQLQELGPQYVQEMAGMGVEDLAKLGVTEQGMQGYVDYVKQVRSLEATDSPAQFLSTMGLNPDELNKTLQDIRVLNQFGETGSDSPLVDILDADGDGKVDTARMPEIKQQVLGLMGGGALSLKELLNQGKRVDSLSLPGLGTPNPGTGVQADVLNMVRQGQKVTADNAKVLGESYGPAELEKLMQLKDQIVDKPALQKVIQKQAADNVDTLMDRVSKGVAPNSADVSRLNTRVDSGFILPPDKYESYRVTSQSLHDALKQGQFKSQAERQQAENMEAQIDAALAGSKRNQEEKDQKSRNIAEEKQRAEDSRMYAKDTKEYRSIMKDITPMQAQSWDIPSAEEFNRMSPPKRRAVLLDIARKQSSSGQG